MGGKYSALEAGSRVPFMVSWPAVIKGGMVSDAIVCQMDLICLRLLNFLIRKMITQDSENIFECTAWKK